MRFASYADPGIYGIVFYHPGKALDHRINLACCVVPNPSYDPLLLGL